MSACVSVSVRIHIRFVRQEQRCRTSANSNSLLETSAKAYISAAMVSCRTTLPLGA